MGGGSRGVGVGRIGNGGREIDPEAFGRAGAFDLALSVKEDGLVWGGVDTCHWRLKVSKSTKDRATVSSVRFDLYCFSKRLQISVYSLSGIESLM